MFSRLSTTEQPTVNVMLDGKKVLAYEGDSVAALLLTSELHCNRVTAISGSPRAPFCLMGVCFECLAVINGVANQRSCMTTVQEGMTIEIQQGAGPGL